MELEVVDVIGTMTTTIHVLPRLRERTSTDGQFAFVTIITTPDKVLYGTISVDVMTMPLGEESHLMDAITTVIDQDLHSMGTERILDTASVA